MRGRAGSIGAATAACALALAVACVPATADSLYTGPGPRPGPDILYAPPAKAPQLENTGEWKAAPILVSGASAYREGEFLYQDFLYDDHGAFEAQDPTDKQTGANTFSRPNGTYTYPTDPAYANNAADLVELRVKPLADATAFRFTLNTLKDPSLVAISVAIGGTPGVSFPFPDGANVRAPADQFLTVHPGSGGGLTADLVTAATGTPVPGGTAQVSLDQARRQIDVRVPKGAWDPTGKVVRLAAGVGLWDKANGRYLLPQPAADGSHPGGSGTAAAPPAFFNVAFRPDEPLPNASDVAGTAAGPTWWRDRVQGSQLATGDITDLHADVDFRKLAAGETDDTGVPKTGPLDRILPSHFEIAQGADLSVNCLASVTGSPEGCPGQYQGQLQPYAIYVPRKPPPAEGYGMTLLMHSLGANYNQYSGSRNQSEFGERGPGSITVTPESRGPDGGYDSYAGAEVFEVWADVARVYKLDPDWSVATGYSMGGLGTFKLAEQFPDLFSRAQPTVGASSDNDMVASLRNVPVLMWNAAVDELVGPELFLPTANKLDSLGYRYELNVFAPAEHLTLAINDEFAPAAAFLGTAKVDRDPAHVTFVAAPALNYPKLDFVSDHAYWLSGVAVRNPAGGGKGTIDVRSHGFGVGDPTPSASQAGAGTLTGGTIPALGFSRQYKTWGSTPSAPKADRLDVDAKNVRSVTINAPRAHVSCAAAVDVKSDGPLDVALTGCAQPRGSAAACADKRTYRFVLNRGRRARAVRAVVYVDGKRKVARRGRSLRSVSIGKLPNRDVTVKVVTTLSNGARVTSTRTYSACGKSKPTTRPHKPRRHRRHRR